MCAADIYVAPDGINTLSGRGSIENPYKTISYIFNNSLISPGDIIIVRGGTYRESITVNVSNVTIKAYQNEKVTVSGADIITSNEWIYHGNGIYKTPLIKSEIETDFTQLFVNGNMQQIARYPNNISPTVDYIVGSNPEMLDPLNPESGFAILLNAYKPSGTNQAGVVTFSDHENIPAIPANTFTNEAIIRGFIGKLRNNIWCYSQAGGNVTKTGSRTVSFTSQQTQGNKWGESDAYSQPEGFEYILDLSVLDYEGEWFYKKLENTLYYKPEGGTLANKIFEVKKRKYGFRVRANNVRIENIHVKAATMDVVSANNLFVFKCTFTYTLPYHFRQNYGVYREGIVLNNADFTTFESCYIGHTWGSGIIILDGADNTTINNCIIEDIGWMGQFTVSLENNGNNTSITNNTFGKTSRFHIRTTESVYAKITDNDFFKAMEMGEDAGSIMYTSTGKSNALDLQGSIFAYNKIHDLDGIPAYDTNPNYKRQKVVGFYLEDVENYTVHHNLVYNLKGNTYTSKRTQSNGQPETTQSKGQIMYLGPRNRDLTKKINYYNNTFWNYDYFLTFWNHNGGRVRDLDLKNNILEPGKLNEINAINATNVASTDLNSFASQAAASPLLYGIELANNKLPTNSSDHFVDVNNNDFSLKPSSTYNIGGTFISGITTATNPAIGAFEGSTTTERNRVFNAGSSLNINSFTNANLSTKLISKSPNKITVFPNPFIDYIHIKLEKSLVDDSNPIFLRLTDLHGKQIIKQTVLAKKINTLNIQPVPHGVYFLEISTKKGVVVHKIIK